MWPSGGGSRGGGGVANINSSMSSEGRSNILGHHHDEHLDSDSTNKGDKLAYDSHSDSGFLSGSNLMSSSSVDEYSSSSCNMLSSPHPASPTSYADNTSTLLASSGCLDSGIDISEQLSSLQLQSGPLNNCQDSGTNLCDDSYVVGHCNRLEDDNSIELERDVDATDIDRKDATERHMPIPRAHVTLLREIFSPDKDGDTQLHVAVMRGFVEVVHHITRLLPHQAFLDLANNAGRTALHLAVSSGVPAIARHLIVCGSSPVTRDLCGNTPLHVACARKQPAMVTHLTRPVTVAEVLQAQLAYRPTHTPGLLAADLSNYQGETCVHVAALAGDKEILQHLTRYGADVNAKECLGGRTALHLAVEGRDPELVAHLVTVCRASVSIESYARLSPYQLALANGAPGLATQLLDLGAPAQLLPPAYIDDDDVSSDYDDSIDFSQVESSVSAVNGWQEVDDIRLAGVPVHPVTQSLGLPQVSTAPHTINADLYY